MSCKDDARRIASTTTVLLFSFPALAYAVEPVTVAPSARMTEADAARAERAAVTARSVTRSEPSTVGPFVVVVRPGDTYGAWAKQQCGSFDTRKVVRLANGWPELRIPVGVTAVINCQSANNPMPVVLVKPAAVKRAGIGWVHPLASGKRGNSCYGWRKSTNSRHRGVDLAQPFGTPIRAAAAGVVHLKRYQAGGAGYYVVIKHAGNIFTVYMHMPGHSPLAIGARVKAGQTIGRVGSTGRSSGNHLHFEVHAGLWSRINPAPFMRSKGVNIGC